MAGIGRVRQCEDRQCLVGLGRAWQGKANPLHRGFAYFPMIRSVVVTVCEHSAFLHRR